MAGKHHVFTQAPKDPNGEVRKRTKIAKGPCRKRSNDHILRAEKFGDLITADHQILNEEGESRNNQRYAVILQGLATQWIQSYRCKTKTFFDANASPKVIYNENSMELAKLVKVSSGIILRQHPIDLRQTASQNEKHAG